MSELQIKWPEEFLPANCSVHVRNELQIAAPIADVWDALTHATKWPEWYPNSDKVKLLDQQSEYLLPGTKFEWETFGVSLLSEVVEFVPLERVAWTAKGIGVWAYHAWLLQENNTGTYVLTEETQKGWLAVAGNVLMPNRMHKYHQLWLEEMEKLARK